MRHQGHLTTARRGLAAAVLAAGLPAVALLAAACGGGDDESAGGTTAADGRQVFDSACSDCHSVTGDTKTGPPLNGIYGTDVRLTDGEAVTVDEEYLARSIREPTSQVVEGFNPIMPDIDLSDDQVDALVAYIRSLSG